VRNGRTCGNLSLSRALGDFEFKRNSASPVCRRCNSREIVPRRSAPCMQLVDATQYNKEIELHWFRQCMGSVCATLPV
jgi:Protein phosphatase 2C